MAEAAHPDNYFIGKGIVTFKPTTAPGFRDIGNVPEFEFTPTVENLDHFSSRSGIREKDKTVVLERGGELRMVMEELTANNLSMLLLGDIDDSDVDNTVVNIMNMNAVSGEVKFYATNEIGPRWDYHFLKVDFIPSGSLQPISDEWGNMEVTGQVAAVDGSFGTATLRKNYANDPPENLALPVVSGIMAVDETLNAHIGTWRNSPTAYAYQWKLDDVDGAATQTLLLTSAMAGQKVEVEVTATNSNGSTVAVSEPRYVGPPINTVAPAITGTAQVGQVLTTTNGTWKGMPTFERQWKADDVAIAGASDLTYTPVVGDVGKVISCTVTAINGGGQTSIDSNDTAAVIA